MGNFGAMHSLSLFIMTPNGQKFMDIKTQRRLSTFFNIAVTKTAWDNQQANNNLLTAFCQQCVCPFAD